MPTACVHETIWACEGLPTPAMRGGCNVHVGDFRDAEQKSSWKRIQPMMFFSDDSGRLYVICVDTNRKQTWVPLPSSCPARRLITTTSEPASQMAPLTSALMSSQATAESIRSWSTEPDTSAREGADTPLLVRGSA